MNTATDLNPEDIIAFWFPDGPAPEPEAHMALWMWRMQGGANDEIMANFVRATERAVQGDFDHWAETPLGRLALIILLDQFPRTIWAGSPEAFAQDPRALELCLEGHNNGHYESLENVWYKTVHDLPLVHCECPDHLANLDLAVRLADQLVEEAPENLKEIYQFAAGQPRKHRDVIRRFGRHAHRNDALGRPSTPEELDYIKEGDFPHVVKMD